MKIKIYKIHFLICLILLVFSFKITGYATPIIYDLEQTQRSTDDITSINDELSDSDKEILKELQKANPNDFNIEEALKKVEIKITPRNNDNQPLSKELSNTIIGFFKAIVTSIVECIKNSIFIVLFTLLMFVILIIKKIKQEKIRNMK